MWKLLLGITYNQKTRRGARWLEEMPILKIKKPMVKPSENLDNARTPKDLNEVKAENAFNPSEDNQKVCWSANATPIPKTVSSDAQ